MISHVLQCQTFFFSYDSEPHEYANSQIFQKGVDWGGGRIVCAGFNPGCVGGEVDWKGGLSSRL